MVTLFIYVAKKTTKNGYSSLLLTLKAQNETKTDMKAQIKLTMGIVIAILAVGVASKSSSQDRNYDSHSRSEEHTSELQSHSDLVCRLLLDKKITKSSTTLRQ